MNMRRFIRAAILPLICLILPGLISCTRVPSDRPVDDPKLEILIPNTGKSDCCLIFAGDSTLLIDTADADDADAIGSILRERGRNAVDLMILTHYDSDHVGAAGSLIRDFDVKSVVGPDYVRNSLAMSALTESLSDKGGALERLTADRILTFGDLEVQISVPRSGGYSDENDYSLIVTLKIGQKKLLFLGDACNARLKEFDRESDGPYDFVKLPHHGDYESALTELFMTCRFRYAVLCEDKAEDSRLAALLENYSVQTCRTYDGQVRVLCDGQSVEVTQ